MPSITWLGTYQRSWLRSDVLAGATAAAVVIPQAMGYATVAGLPVQVGLYTCIVAMIAYALLGSARKLSMSTTSTIVALAGLAFVQAGVHDDPQAAMSAVATLTLLVGAALLLFWLLRLGWVVDTISDTVIAGLKVGVGLTIIVDQLPDLLGIPAGESGFFRGIGNALRHLDDMTPATAVLAGGTLVGLFAVKRWAPSIPGPLLAVVVGIVAVALFGIDDDSGVALIPPVPSGLPGPALPSLEHADELIPYAIAIAAMAFMETIAVGRSTRDPLDPPISNSRELMANGVAAVVGSFFSTAPPAGGFSQTMVNANAGARTQLSQLVTAGVAVAVALFLAPVLSDLPQASLAAIVVVAVAGLVSLSELQRIARVDRLELFIAVVTGAIAIVTNLLGGVIAGVVFTFYIVLRKLNHPVVVELRQPPTGGDLQPAREGDVAIPGLLALRVEGGLYTMNIRGVQARILELVTLAEPPPRVVLLDAGGTADTSVTVLDVFAETDQQLARRGITLWVAAFPTAAFAKVKRAAAWSEWRDAGKVHATVRDAVAAFESLAPKD